MIDIELFERLGQASGVRVGGPPPPDLGEVFALVTAGGWSPRNPAYDEAELSQLETSTARGTCLEPLVLAGDTLYIDPSTPALPGDLVSFKLSARGAAAQNSGLPPGQSPCRAGDLWVKAFVPYHGYDMLLEKYGNAATATLLACESPDDTPVLRPVRQIVRGGRLLFTPEHYSSQVGLNAATSVVNQVTSSPVLVPVSTSALTSIISASMTQPFGCTAVITNSGMLSVVNSGSLNPLISAAWTIEDELGATYGGGSLTLYSIAASSTAEFPIVQEVTVTIPANTAKTFTMLARYGTTGTTVSGSCTGNLKLELIKR